MKNLLKKNNIRPFGNSLFCQALLYLRPKNKYLQTYTLFQLNEYIRRILALNFAEPLWITAEIAQIGESRGHFFLSLVEKQENSEEILAQSEAALWGKTHKRLRRQMGITLHEILQAGRSVKLKVQVEYHERYGLKLIIHEIDPTFTLGQLELQRRKTIEALKKAGHLRRNALHALPRVVQRLAIISSETAAGYHDFQSQLLQNPYGYAFSTSLFTSAMQGQKVVTELPAQIKKINRQQRNFDAVVVIRGGGSRLDLSAFDELSVAESLAKCKLPVITGIGHEIDETVADLVAHTRLKTPTAVAEWLIGRALQFEGELGQLAQQIQLMSKQHIQRETILLNSLRQQFRHLSQGMIQKQEQLLNFITSELPFRAKTQLRTHQQEITQLEKIVHLLSIESTLERGYTLTQVDGQSINSHKTLKPGDIIKTVFRDGAVNSEVQGTEEDI